MSEQNGLAKMREPFLSHQISKLCRSTRKDNPKSTCRVCGGYHGQPSIALDYVGHAALTDRLLDCDPSWTWEPVALDAQGYPAIDKDGGMWIKLTVCGVTRYGYGDAQGKTGGDAMKERIGDALRNAAMRFGAALDLWHKGELHITEEEPAQSKAAPQKATPAKTTKELASDEQIAFIRDLLMALGEKARCTEDDVLKDLSLTVVNGQEKWLTIAGLSTQCSKEYASKLIEKAEKALR